MEHEISSIQILHHKKQVTLHRGLEGRRDRGGKEEGRDGGKEGKMEGEKAGGREGKKN